MTEILKMKLKNRKIFTTVLVIPQIIHVLPLVKLLRLKISGVRMKQKYLLELLTLCKLTQILLETMGVNVF